MSVQAHSSNTQTTQIDEIPAKRESFILRRSKNGSFCAKSDSNQSETTTPLKDSNSNDQTQPEISYSYPVEELAEYYKDRSFQSDRKSKSTFRKEVGKEKEDNSESIYQTKLETLAPQDLSLPSSYMTEKLEKSEKEMTHQTNCLEESQKEKQELMKKLQLLNKRISQLRLISKDSQDFTTKPSDSMNVRNPNQSVQDQTEQSLNNQLKKQSSFQLSTSTQKRASCLKRSKHSFEIRSISSNNRPSSALGSDLVSSLRNKKLDPSEDLKKPPKSQSPIKARRYPSSRPRPQSGLRSVFIKQSSIEHGLNISEDKFEVTLQKVSPSAGSTRESLALESGKSREKELLHRRISCHHDFQRLFSRDSQVKSKLPSQRNLETTQKTRFKTCRPNKSFQISDCTIIEC